MSWQQQNPYGGYGQQVPGSGFGQVHPGGGYGQLPPGCPPGVDPTVFYWFESVDQDKSGKISAHELQQALMNNKMKQFNSETCRLMIGMFDQNRDGTINIQEFASLWNYIQQWRSCFDSFDTDRSGNINAQELHRAFQTFGYTLSIDFCKLIVRVFDKSSANSIDFDDFIQVCVMLRMLTDKFRDKDTNRNGFIQLQYEQFLEMVLDSTLSMI